MDSAHGDVKELGTIVADELQTFLDDTTGIQAHIDKGEYASGCTPEVIAKHNRGIRVIALILMRLTRSVDRLCTEQGQLLRNQDVDKTKEVSLFGWVQTIWNKGWRPVAALVLVLGVSMLTAWRGSAEARVVAARVAVKVEQYHTQDQAEKQQIVTLLSEIKQDLLKGLNEKKPAP